MINKTNTYLRISYIIGYISTLIMLILTICFRNYFYMNNNITYSTLYINIPITAVLFIASTTLLIILLVKEHKTTIKVQKVKTKKTNDIKSEQSQTIKKTVNIKVKNSQSNNIIAPKKTKAIKIKKQYPIQKIIYIILLILSTLNLICGIVLLNLPLFYMLVMPIIITCFILSAVFFIIANQISKNAKYKNLIETIKNQNRE